MFKIKILIILLLKLHLTIGIKTANFCRLEQKVCHGYYDSKEKYQTKCNLIKCSENYNIKCSINTCSNSKTECKKYKQLNSYVHILLGKQEAHNNTITNINRKEILEKFNVDIKNCEKNIYKFEANNFCLIRLNCFEKIRKATSLGYNYMNKRIDCKCPSELGFKCGKYCTTDSNACDYNREHIKTLLFSKINKCDNDININSSFFRSFLNKF